MLGGTPLRDGDFVAVDIETTGPIPGYDSIIEIGAVRVSRGEIAGYFETLVCPERPIPPAIIELTGITEEMVRAAPSVRDAVCAFRAFAKGAVLVAHNHRFDMGFLDLESERCGCDPFPRPVLDTLMLSKRLHPEERRHNLRDVSRRYGIGSVPTHRALADACATAEVFKKMVEELADAGIVDAAGAARLCGIAPRGDLARKLTLATALPDRPGVFMLLDETGRVLYIARARRLRSRVRSLFYRSPEEPAADAVARTAKVRAFQCSSPLHAQLLESRLKARYRPPLNQDTERGRRMVYLRVDTRQPYPSLTIMSRRPRTGTAVGPFTNVWAVKRLADALREHYGLRMCGRRLNGSGSAPSCPHRTGSACPRPCLGAVSKDEYSARLAAALDVFNGGHLQFRAVLQALRERAAMDLRYEDAIVHRDTIKALDKCLSALDVVRAATSVRGSAIIERHEDDVTVVLMRHGQVAGIVRGSTREAGVAILERRVRRVCRRVFAPVQTTQSDGDLTHRQLRELFIVDAYRRHAHPLEIPLDAGPDELASAVCHALRDEDVTTTASVGAAR